MRFTEYPCLSLSKFSVTIISSVCMWCLSASKSSLCRISVNERLLQAPSSVSLSHLHITFHSVLCVAAIHTVSPQKDKQ